MDDLLDLTLKKISSSFRTRIVLSCQPLAVVHPGVPSSPEGWRACRTARQSHTKSGILVTLVTESSS